MTKKLTEKEEKRIKKAFANKKWPDIASSNSWSIFKIMAEFVYGYQALARIGPCVSIYGSARTKPGKPHYKLAQEIAKKISEAGLGVITGGGPGLMEAANKGAKSVKKSPSVGLNINLPFEQEPNPYQDRDKTLLFDYFFVRKVMFMKYSQGFVVMPGGVGTLDELFEALTLIQTDKRAKFPVILVDSKYWGPLIDWMKNTMLDEHGYISPEDMNLFKVVDTADEAVAEILKFYSRFSMKPNF
jgi:hypothetical protein